MRARRGAAGREAGDHDGGDFALILAGARAGDERAWARLLGDLMGPLLGYLRLRGAPEPDDLVSEVLFRAARNIRRFEGDHDRFRAWIFTIAHHALVDDRRRRRRAPALVALDELAETTVGAAAGDDPLAAVVAADGRDLLRRLTPDQRDVLLLRVVGGFSIEEVAGIVGKEPNAVKQLQHRAVRALRRLLAGSPLAPAAADGEVTH